VSVLYVSVLGSAFRNLSWSVVGLDGKERIMGNNSGCGMYVGIAVGVVLVILVLLAPLAFVMVDAGDTCAVLTWGQVTSTAGPGLHLRWPIAQKYACFSARAVVYETSEDPETSQADYKDWTVGALTNDGQQIKVSYSVATHVNADNAMWVYANAGENMDRVIERVVKFYSRSIVRLTMQEYAAEVLYTGDIQAAESGIWANLEQKFASRHVVLDDFVIRRIQFEQEYIDAIEAKQIAEQSIITARHNAEAEKERANQREAEADGERRAAVMQADGEAYAIQVVGEMLEQYPQVLQFEFIKQLDGVTWGIMPADSVTPFLPISPTTGVE
jgi:regulator of protease activity HflC (stomatin/prohibitin superfamily)